jgi:hypothetical protein
MFVFFFISKIIFSLSQCLQCLIIVTLFITKFTFDNDVISATPPYKPPKCANLLVLEGGSLFIATNIEVKTRQIQRFAFFNTMI